MFLFSISLCFIFVPLSSHLTHTTAKWFNTWILTMLACCPVRHVAPLFLHSCQQHSGEVTRFASSATCSSTFHVESFVWVELWSLAKTEKTSYRFLFLCRIVNRNKFILCSFWKPFSKTSVKTALVAVKHLIISYASMFVLINAGLVEQVQTKKYRSDGPNSVFAPNHNICKQWTPEHCSASLITCIIYITTH